MSWLTNIKSKITGDDKVDIPDNLWLKCPACSRVVFHKELENVLYVCPHCHYHLRISARTRAQQLADDGTWVEIPLPKTHEDPLKFKDRITYKSRLSDNRTKTGNNDAFIAGICTLYGAPAVVGILDFTFIGGSMGSAMGEGIITAVGAALAKHLPLVLVTGSGGARMQESIFSLMQMPRTIFAISQLKQAKLPYIVVLTDPTTGGVTASFAMVGDIHIAEPNAVIGFAGRGVIEETIHRKLPADFQTSQYLLDHGFVDMVVERKHLNAELSKLLTLLTRDYR